MAAEPRRTYQDSAAVGRAVGAGRTLAASMPRLILEARRVAATVNHGLHGRRRAGPGENFWQYRRFVSGEPASRVDWRRSARDDHLYVREQEWEAAHTVWIWPDRSPSMHFASPLVRDTKLYRTLVIALALAEVLVEGGERVGIPGLTRPTGSRNVVELMAQAIVYDRSERASLPPSFAPSPLAEVVLLSDLWSEIGDVRRTITQLSGSGAHGHVVETRGSEALLHEQREGGVDEYGPMKYALSLQMGTRQFYQRPPNSDVTDEQKAKIKQAVEQIKHMG